MISSNPPHGWWRTVTCGIAVGRWSDEQLRRWIGTSSTVSELAAAEERRRKVLDGPVTCPRCGAEIPTNDVHHRSDGVYCTSDVTPQW